MAPSHKQWIIPFAVQLIPAGCLLIGSIWMRESPRWRFTKGQRERALKDLCWIRNLPEDHPYILEEVEAIDAQIEHDRINIGPGFWKPFIALKQKPVSNILSIIFQTQKLTILVGSLAILLGFHALLVSIPIQTPGRHALIEIFL